MGSNERVLIDQRLSDLLRLTHGCPAHLREAIEYGLLAPGKRLRPTLAMLAAKAVGGMPEDALSAGCAVEMIHAYSLIHDDLPAMDDDDLRRGRPTVHKVYGDALAILVGDALQALAFQVVASEYPATTAAAMIRELAAAAGAAGMVGGQVDDLTWDGKIAGSPREPTVEALQAVHAAKTGALFHASLQLGYLAVRGERDQRATGLDPAGLDARHALDEFGRCFGLAFQITDDLLDVVGDEARAGKRVGKDSARGKLTYPGMLGIEESRRRVVTLIERAEAALAPLGEPARPLVDLAHRLTRRDK